MNGTIYLIGGGELRNGETWLIDKDILSLSPKGSTFVFFGSAAGDSLDYANTISSVYGQRYKILVPTEVKGRDFAINAIESADIIYLGGGDTDQLLRVFAQWGLVDYLQTAISRGAHVAGMSAGAQALSSWYIHEDKDIFELRKGWGIVSTSILVHAVPASFSKAKLLWSDHKMARNFVAVEEGAAWRISTQGSIKVGSGNIWTMSSRD